MEIKLDLISKELIKPSSPTPLHLHKLKLSLADQSQAAISIPYVHFYEKPDNITTSEISNLLKHSLSNTLTIFYPLAGRINNYSYVDCNDEGALFIETKANCQLSDILQNRNQYSKKFIPFQPEKVIHQYGCSIQITYFTCGGLAISIATPHMLGDGHSQLTFIRSWAAITRGDIVDIPSFDSASIFPPKDKPEFKPSDWVLKENVVTKSFVFDAPTLSALRDKYRANDEKLSRVQTLCAFILSRLIAHAKDRGIKNRFIVFNQVNVRPLLDLPNSNNLFGNIVISATAVIDLGKEDEIPRRIQDSFTKVNKDYVKKELEGGSESISVRDTFSADWLNGDMDKYIFSSLCRFPAYDMADFGWGKPEWITTSGMAFDNLILFADTKRGGGIEVWVNLTEEDMAKFEKDEVLLSYLSSTSNENTNLTPRL